MKNISKRRATLRDVARAAGVSHTTVSNAFSRPDQLSGVLRDQILAAARSLGYTGPDPAARALRTGRHGAVGLVFSEDLPFAFSDPTASLFLQGVAEACRARNDNLLLIAARAASDGADPASAGLPEAIRNAGVDGFILYSLARDNPVIAPVRARGLPLVVVDQPRLPGVPHVGIDDYRAARQAALHLLALGHRRFAILSLHLRQDGWEGPASSGRIEAATYGVAKARLDGYLAAFRDAGVPAQSVQILECPFIDERRAHDLIRPLVVSGSGVRPTGVLAMNDRLAIGAVAAAREAGLVVPADFSVVGFDDVANGGLIDLPLTTVLQPHAEKGRRAVQMLTAAIPGDCFLETELVVRASSGPSPLHPD